MNTDYRKALVDNAAATVKLDEVNLAYTKVQYERYKKLSKTKSVSKESFQHWQNEYFQAKDKLAADKATLKLNQTVYKTCWPRAEYDAIVDKVFFPFGLPAAELDVMQISQLRPIFVHVKMNRDIARSITNKTPIAVYPVNSNKPVGVFTPKIILTDDGINLFVENYQLPPVISNKNGKAVPFVICFPVTNLYSTYPDLSTLGVPVNALCKDATGTHVWKAVGLRSFQPNKGIPSIFPVKKVYLTLVDRICKIAGVTKYQQISPNKDLTLNDMLVLNPPKNLQENDEVCLDNQKYLFMPGDTEKL